MIGTKNKDAILQSFASLHIVNEVCESGLFEAKGHPWLAASPDGFALFDLPGSHGAEGENLSDTLGHLK